MNRSHRTRPVSRPTVILGFAMLMLAGVTTGCGATGGQIGKSYTIARAGVFMPEGDLKHLDEGFAASLVLGRELLPFLAVEGEVGYLEADGGSGAGGLDVWAVPAFVNARASLPIAIFEPYAGVGLGGMYADYRTSGGAIDDTDILAAWQAFLGLEVGLGNLAVGAEYKYLQSEQTKDDFQIEGGVATIFLSVPF